MNEPITINTPVQFQDPLPQSVDVTIIGGGVIGVFAALNLARAGKRVLLCEKGRIAGEQSSRNWGWIRQQGRDVAELPIMMRALALWHEVNAETNGACGVQTGGTCYMASSDAAEEENAQWIKIAAEHNLDSRLMSGGEVHDHFEGHATRQWKSGLITPSDARAEPWNAVPTVAKLAQQKGTLIRENCAVRALEINAGCVTGVVTEAGRVKSERVILAAGAWSSLFARRHGIRFPQLTLRGTVARTASLPQVFNGSACDEKLAIRRRQDGGYTLALVDRHSMFIGPDAFRHAKPYLPLLKSSWRTLSIWPAQPHGFPDGWTTPRKWSEDEVTPFEVTRVLEPKPSQAQVARMAKRFAARFAGLGKPVIKTAWAGMIDAMPDVVPIVDHVPGCDGLIVATGMSGHGFGIGPGYGEILAKLATGAQPGFDLSRFRFSRFSDGSTLEIGPEL